MVILLGSSVHATTRYVSLSGGNIPPYTNWVTAATNIQYAIDVCSIGDVVIVTNGTYDTGGRVGLGPLPMTNRVVIDKPITILSVNGPTKTAIKGARDPLTTNGNAAIRCVCFTTNGVLCGFTLTNGATKASGEVIRSQSGGGAWCMQGGTLSNCTLAGNTAQFYGGGIFYGVINNCDLLDNSATYEGGGWFNSVLNNCIISGNITSNGGGGAYGTVNNCTISYNSAFGNGGGTYDATLKNSIIYYNEAVHEPNWSGSLLQYCCTTPTPTNGTGNITNNPQFVTGASSNVDLRPTSPCIDSGQTESWMTNTTDVAGRPRVMNGCIDMGACEFRFESSLKGALAGVWIATNAMMRLGNPTTNSPYKAAVNAVARVPLNAVDWVLVSVRESPTSAPAASVSAFLMPDGRIVGAEGGSNVFVEAKGNLYGVLQHRNHLAVMSAAPVFTNRIVTFDFSSDPNLLWGGTNAVIQVSTNRWGMIPGDADGDGAVRAVDELIRKSQSQ